jgi:hypothetical protein
MDNKDKIIFELNNKINVLIESNNNSQEQICKLESKIKQFEHGYDVILKKKNEIYYEKVEYQHMFTEYDNLIKDVMNNLCVNYKHDIIPMIKQLIKELNDNNI